MSHATVRIAGYVVPLIGIDQSATEDECDLCHYIWHISDLTFTGTQFLCGKCNKGNNYETRNERMAG